MDRLRQHWGDELDQSLIDIMVQRIVYEPKFEEVPIEKRQIASRITSKLWSNTIARSCLHRIPRRLQF